MTKADYINQLNHKLRAMPDNERRDALEYYDGYLSDAEDEAAAMAQLGSPGEVAASILVSHAAKEPAPGEAGRKAGAKGIRTAWMVALAIFALPVGLPLVIVLAAIAFSLIFSLLGIVFSVGVSSLASLLVGVVSMAIFPMVVLQDAGTALLFLGSGLIGLGFGILLIKCTAMLMKGFPMIARFVGRKIGNKIARRNRHGK